MKTLLLVEDEREILDNNREFFTGEGYRILTAENLAEARQRLQKETPDAIVLDIMLPDGNGLDLLTELRAAGNKIPIIMLTAWGKSSDVARGLKLGANDYVSKPFTYDVLQARVEAMLRDAERLPETVTKGKLTLKITPMVALVDGEDILLSSKEFALLQFFIQHENRCLLPEYIYQQVWGQSAAGDARQVKYQISRLREKIANSGYAIIFKRGEGYVFEQG